MGLGDLRMGLAQLRLQLRVGRGRCRSLVVQRRGQLDTTGDPAIAEDGGIRAQLVAYQLHGLTHIGGEETFDLHDLDLSHSGQR